jgi:hypothetical protein
VTGIELKEKQPWQPRQGLHVHGPARLPICFKQLRAAGA